MVRSHEISPQNYVITLGKESFSLNGKQMFLFTSWFFADAPFFFKNISATPGYKKLPEKLKFVFSYKEILDSSWGSGLRIIFKIMRFAIES